MQVQPRATRVRMDVKAMRSWSVLLLVAFSLFAPLAGAFGAGVAVPLGSALATGGCSMSTVSMGPSEMEDGCCCAAPVVPVQDATESCCSDPAKNVPGEAPQLNDRCKCESSPQAPHSPASGASTHATVPAPDPSSTLVELMVAARHQPSSPMFWASVPASERQGRAPCPGSLAPTRIVDSCTSSANRIGILRGQATRLALLATLRR